MWPALFLVAVACTAEPKGDFVSGEPDVLLHHIDKGVDAAAAEKVLRRVLAAVPQLKQMRAAQEKPSGGRVRLNLSLQSGPDPQAVDALERSHYFVYVNLQGSSGLLKTYTFVVAKDLNEVKAFDEDGDSVISIPKWLSKQER
ncbi:MAG: hypothetical protein HY901_28810 [Deltaproteobacteria bacterium]|nr:hypothetical protein [Deltaproteobacteria bacterium]